jgi:CheY-like chemotaxis protein
MSREFPVATVTQPKQLRNRKSRQHYDAFNFQRTILPQIKSPAYRFNPIFLPRKMVETATSGVLSVNCLVMIVDDHAVIRRLLREVFEAEQWEVSDAMDGADGVQKVQEVKPNLIILDLSMPVTNGLEAARVPLSFRHDPRKARVVVHVTRPSAACNRSRIFVQSVSSRAAT